MLADAGAELGHQHRVGAQVVEEVSVDRRIVDADDAAQDLGEDPLGGGGGGGGLSHEERSLMPRSGAAVGQATDRDPADCSVSSLSTFWP